MDLNVYCERCGTKYWQPSGKRCSCPADVMGEALELSFKLLTEARTEAERLWQLLDDISTLGDQLKPEINHYFNAIHRKCEKRNGSITSDGYTLKWNPPTQT